MAEEPERNMLFDLRGRRKRVIQVIYVILAILMAASLVVIGMPGGLSPWGNGGTSVNTDVAKANLERAEEVQQQLVAKPNNPNLTVELIRARFAAGQSLYETDSETGAASITDEAVTQYELAAESWAKYLRLTKNQPDPEVAQLMATVLFNLSAGSTVAQFQANIADAAIAQGFVADDAIKQQKQGGASAASQLTTLAMYQLYAQKYDAADKTLQKALAATEDDAEKKQIRQTFNSTRQDAKRVGKQIDQAVKQARKDGGKSLENPLGSLGSDNSIQGTTTP